MVIHDCQLGKCQSPVSFCYYPQYYFYKMPCVHLSFLLSHQFPPSSNKMYHIIPSYHTSSHIAHHMALENILETPSQTGNPNLKQTSNFFLSISSLNKLIFLLYILVFLTTFLCLLLSVSATTSLCITSTGITVPFLRIHQFSILTNTKLIYIPLPAISMSLSSFPPS